MQMYDNTTGHIIADYKGKLMLVDTGAAITFFDEYQGVRVSDLSRMLGQPLDGVLGMDSFKGRVLSLTRDSIHFNGVVPAHKGAPMYYIAGVPCLDIKVNEIACRAAIRTGATASYVTDTLISRDKYTRTVRDAHPYYGSFAVRMYANYFSVGDKNYFAEAGELPREFASLSSIGVDAVIGTDLLDRFEIIMDFSRNRLHLLSR